MALRHQNQIDPAVKREPESLSANTLSRSCSRSIVRVGTLSDEPQDFSKRHGWWSMTHDTVIPEGSSELFMRGAFTQKQEKAKKGLEGNWQKFFMPQSVYYHMRVNNMVIPSPPLCYCCCCCYYYYVQVRRDPPTDWADYEFFTEVDRLVFVTVAFYFIYNNI
jgi:hypothetical protein